ncbi:MAG: N-acetyl-alpha-D-glucosaminyl L-malate synthase BshA [Candidatus Eisenbacteria bacterium]|uniref:N-acetyl-alpha-D-glucosaminyl L-malate synthase BshA n=1 Tax=Eiseniibacteriota bacterium TaxID=2212470 RepID=A0A849SPL0_UNCEI|nr:N-acetyl-alpha-D-glucosaminyl L-malate synthase BshA [Candidatus Eisenbacteria bacterium]
MSNSRVRRRAATPQRKGIRKRVASAGRVSVGRSARRVGAHPTSAPCVKLGRKPRKIGIACYAHFGGSGVVATELGLALARRGYEVHFVAHHLPFRLRSFRSNVIFHEVATATYPVFDQDPLSLLLASKLADVTENYDLDVLHVHYALPFSASAYLARQLVLPRQIGVVTTLHGTDITVVGIEPAFFRMTKFSIESSDRVTAVSQYLKERAEESLGIQRPIEVIYNFVDPKVFRPGRPGSLRLAPAHVGVMMHASNFRQVKNIPAVIHVFAEVRRRIQAKLVMIGDGPERSAAEALARELGVHRDVLFLGNQDSMEELLPLADVFLLPSSSESFGLVALEAMSAEVPVVASDVGGIPEVVEHGKTGFLHAPTDLAGQVASTLKLLTDERLRKAMGRRGRRVARDRFSEDEMVDRYIAVYDSMI